MRRLRLRSMAVPAFALLAGCAGVPVLKEPDSLPRNTHEYQVKTLADRNPRYVMLFDYSGCVDNAVVSSSGFSGRTSIAGAFDVSKIIKREFALAAAVNFAPVASGKKADGIVYVETEKLLVNKSWSQHTAEITFDIEVISLAVVGRQRIFRKKYRVSDTSREKGGGESVPLCVYSCVQQAVKQFVDDMSMCQEIADFVERNE